MEDRKAVTPPASRKTDTKPPLMRRASELAPSSNFNYSLRPLTPPILKMTESPHSSPLRTPNNSINDLTLLDSTEPGLRSNHERKDSVMMANVVEDEEGNESIVLYLPDQEDDNTTFEFSVNL